MASDAWLAEASIASLQEEMAAGRLTAVDLVEMFMERIDALDRNGPTLRSVLEVNPDALEIARALDQERASRGARGPLHGIPILLKDSIDTADKMETTAGSLALLGDRPIEDAAVVQRLRGAGAVILGKANMSEWAYFRSSPGSSGWSARGGQGRNPYSLERSPGGSSSGSGSAVAAGLCVASLGTETNGSILCPSALNGIVGVKPTVGLTSRRGVIPISHTQDTIGPMARTVADAAALLSAIAGPDPLDPATDAARGKAQRDYSRFLDPKGLAGARLGVPRKGHFGYSAPADRVAEEALDAMRRLGATIVDPADLPSWDEIAESGAELEVLLYEFKAGIGAYLRERRPGSPLKRLADLIRFNEEHREAEMRYFGQNLFEQAEEKGGLEEPGYRRALAEIRRLSRTEGIDAVLDAHDLDALVMPSYPPAWCIDLVNGDHVLGGSSHAAAMAGYPAVTVPAGFVHGLPVGVTFVGRAFSEPTLLRLAYAFEHAVGARRPPEFRPVTP